MLHELLLALLGFTGDFIVDDAERIVAGGGDGDRDHLAGGGSTFRLAADLSFLHPSERSAIERLLPLGFYYREINRFATQSRGLSWIQSVTDVSSLADRTEHARRDSVYRRAIANGIAEILSVYRAAVLQVEQNLLAEPTPILATVTQGLSKFDVLLPPLYKLISEIEQKDIKGGQLLNLLHKQCHCGIPELQSCIQRLLWHAHQVMFNQLSCWMVHGILHDQYGEFFIRRQDIRIEEKEQSKDDAIDKLMQKSSDDTTLSDWHSGYHISLDMLPDYLNMWVAESVLFTGKATRVLRNPSAGFRQQDLFSPAMKGSYGGQSLGGSVPQKDTSNISRLSVEELFPQSEVDKIDTMLQELKQKPEFNRRLFESAVGSIRTIAANHLWQLVVVRADLNGHLKALKDYFLLAKGDFFQCFLEESRQLMRLPPRKSTAEADLMVPFQLAALKTISEEDKYFRRVSLRMPSVGTSTTYSQKDISKLKVASDGNLEASFLGKSSTEVALDGWESISLEYSVDWPLQLFFTQEILSKYMTVFQYLIKLKRTQMELEKYWAVILHRSHADFANLRKDRKNGSISQLSRQRPKPMWQVREHMAFLIRNLQFYIQVDVIESQWNVLQGHLQDSHDFTELVSFHQEYLSALISQSFLDIGSVSRIMDSIMKLCLQFCWRMEQSESDSLAPEIHKIAEEFTKKSNQLYTILRNSRLAGSQRAPYLRQFLMRLNFNSFLEAAAKGMLTVGKPLPALATRQQ